MLGVDDGAGELLDAGEVGGVALVVVVVAGAEEDEPGPVDRGASPAAPSVCTVQVLVAESQSAERMWVLKRMCLSIPCLCAVVAMYSRICSPPAMASVWVHGSHGKHKVYVLVSQRTPGYRKTSHVPPICARRSRMT